jgi:TatD DNase family protein
VTALPVIDTHCHLALLEDRGLLQAALEGAHAAGVEAMVTIGVNLRDSDRNRRLAEAHPNVWFSVGWDPQQSRPPDSVEMRELAALLRHPRAVAVGEVGLDLFFRPGYHETPLDVQRRSLMAMLELAVAAGKPVVIHDRDAHDEVLDALAAVPAARGVMHCFTGDAAHAARCVARGFVISFSGIVTFPRAEPIQEAARQVPAGTYVVETDSPFLAPVPRRGTTNLPERVADTLAAVAGLRGITEEVTRRDTTLTARRLFNLEAPALVGR